MEIWSLSSSLTKTVLTISYVTAKYKNKSYLGKLNNGGEEKKLFKLSKVLAHPHKIIISLYSFEEWDKFFGEI